MTEVKKPSIPLHPMVFSLKAKIDSLEKRLVLIEEKINVKS